MMKSPTALVTVTLAAAILVAASLLIAASARGDDASFPYLDAPISTSTSER
jgi:hypothetical protein